MTLPDVTFALPSPQTITRVELENGVTVLVYENYNSQAVVLNGSVYAGGVYEPLSKSGLASLTAAALMRGTTSRDFDTIYGTLEELGADLNLNSGRFTVGFTGRALREDFGTLLTILNDVLRNPVFPDELVEFLRQQRLTALGYNEQDTRFRAERAFREALYPADHPYHYVSYGSTQSLPGISVDDMRSFHAKHYGPRGMIVSVVGHINADDAVKLVRDTFGDWQNPDQSERPILPDVALPTDIVRVHETLAEKTQSDFILGAIGPSRTADDYQAASLANSILGEFGMMGRVGNVIREQNGLAYYAFSRIEGGAGPGAWSIAAGVAPENVDKAIDMALDEMRRIVTEPVSQVDLEDNQSYFTGRLPLRLESIGGIASILQSIERYNLGLDYLVGYKEHIFSHSAEDLMQAAQRYLNPDALVIATAGP
jgi:zinc protease